MVKSVVTILFFVVTFFCDAQTLPPGFAKIKVGESISAPTVMAFAPDGRIFVAQQSGALRVIKNDTLLPTPFATLAVNSSGERGLIGVTFDPNFSVNHYIYVYHTVSSAGQGLGPHNRISRFTADGDRAVPGSRMTILTLDPLSSATNHNGGALAFGPDGKLYVAVGDNALSSNAQNLDTYHGKMLRINADDTGSAPTDNPFYSETASEQRKRVWAYGLRNPFTFSIQPGTGKIFVNDVGQFSVEEINDATQGGRNFGWPTAEGPSTNPEFTNPVFSYNHSGPAPSGCAITGGSFFNPSFTTYPISYVGRYFFVDYCSDWIYSLDISGTPVATLFASSTGSAPVSLQAGPDGNLYYLSRGLQSLFRITSSNSSAPIISQQPNSQSVPKDDQASFTVVATGTAPLSYEWQKNSIAIEGANESTFTIPNAQFSDEGAYRVKVTNQAGEVLSQEATLTVSPNAKPTAIIDMPQGNSTYAAGTTITFSGQGSDAEDGDLLASSLSWEINFHHDEHIHDQPPVSGVSSGTFDIPNQGETSPNVWYRITLVATDSKGFQGMDSVDIVPRLSQLVFDTEPTGLQLTLDGQLMTSPVIVESVEGLQREIGVPVNQILNDKEYVFVNWSNEGNATQMITTPEDDTEYTATFDLVLGIEQRGYATPYPMPARDWIELKVSEATEFQLIDMLGRKWELMSEIANDIVKLDVQQLPAGLYILNIAGHNRNVYQKIVIQR